ncbi:MAG TPA: TetR/AcrR family transcriptional regulator [Sandaracinaceae bacterium LLY-WYZ-13_1]|nr:TetR/AcrR family transcriptional regulator [Sandaracinaceae bacterium LLY-WYZ-13_1]
MSRVTAPARSRLQVDERRAQLLELGLRLFSERAYDEVSIDDIAREAGVSKGLLYHYFGGKRAFYVACVDAAAAALVERTEPTHELSEPDRARRGLEAYLDFVEERAGAYGALMRSGIGHDPEVAAILEGARRAIVDRMLEGMGVRPPRPLVRLAARSWIGQVEAACLEWLERRDVPREALIRLLLGALYGTLSTVKLLDPEAPFELDPSLMSALEG